MLLLEQVGKPFCKERKVVSMFECTENNICVVYDFANKTLHSDAILKYAQNRPGIH